MLMHLYFPQPNPVTPHRLFPVHSTVSLCAYAICENLEIQLLKSAKVGHHHTSWPLCVWASRGMWLACVMGGCSCCTL